VRHNLGVRDTLVLWGEARFALPTWFTERFPARYVNARLFDWSDPDLAEATLHTPPGQTQGCAWPCLSVHAGTAVRGWHRAKPGGSAPSFDGLRSPRKALLGQLLSCCTSVKAVRLFLTWRVRPASGCR
jgi:hypothetical protein